MRTTQIPGSKPPPDMSLNDDQLEPAEPTPFPISESVAEPEALQVEPTDELTEDPIAEPVIVHDESVADQDPEVAVNEDDDFEEEAADADDIESDVAEEAVDEEDVAEEHAVEAKVADDLLTEAPEVDAEIPPTEDAAADVSLAQDEARDEESAVDELIESYQSHMLDDEPEPEFVAHVEAKVAPVVVPVEAAVAAEAGDEPVQVVSPEPVILDLIAFPVARSVQAESVPLSAEEQNGSEEIDENESLVGSALRTETPTMPGKVRSADPAEEPAVQWQPMPTAQPAPVLPIADYARQLLVEAPDEELSPLGFEDEATEEDQWQEDIAADAAASADAMPHEATSNASDSEVDESAADEAESEHDDPESEESEFEEAATFADPDDDEADADLQPAGTGGWWTLPLLCIGIAIIACCMVIPQADANRRLAYERAALRSDLESIQTQVATNDEFLRKLASDPGLAERLAQRQLNLQRAGTKVLPIRTGDSGTSPFDLVQVPKPPRMEPYEPVGGTIATICRDTRARLYVMGVGLFLLAAGLVMGFSPDSRSRR